MSYRYANELSTNHTHALAKVTTLSTNYLGVFGDVPTNLLMSHKYANGLSPNHTHALAGVST